jgi:6-pyruvoyltetrahydropterin/6-carboxytetrahydropterin synthase
MFRLTREVRFAVNHAADDQIGRAPSNSYGGFPSLTGLGYFLTLRATIAGEVDPESSYLANIKEIDGALRERAVPHITQTIRRSPRQFGAKNLAGLLAGLRDAWRPAALESLSLGLSPFLWITCLAEEFPMTRLSQMFEFSASHRLHNPALSEEENRRTFGKCNNPHGHGHNYQLQVTLAGTTDGNGLIVDVPAFERTVKQEVIDRFDHKNLNVELPEFAGVIPSVENIARVIYGVLKPALQNDRVRLAWVTVWETPKTWCEYSES